jgi:hypothetical protein
LILLEQAVGLELPKMSQRLVDILSSAVVASFFMGTLTGIFGFQFEVASRGLSFPVEERHGGDLPQAARQHPPNYLVIVGMIATAMMVGVMYSAPIVYVTGLLFGNRIQIISVYALGAIYGALLGIIIGRVLTFPPTTGDPWEESVHTVGICAGAVVGALHGTVFAIGARVLVSRRMAKSSV